jgi:hypothetical protein
MILLRLGIAVIAAITDTGTTDQKFAVWWLHEMPVV